MYGEHYDHVTRIITYLKGGDTKMTSIRYRTLHLDKDVHSQKYIEVCHNRMWRWSAEYEWTLGQFILCGFRERYIECLY